MAQNKRKFFAEEAKLQSRQDKDFNSLNSKTGYKDTGNEAQVHAKARAMRQSDNGSHM
ncbi:hypothetical protein M2651_10665 [Clostridium sp. SYSU_GA19001]|uniref:hypothetical protein n=1 Tax=Clostridium caldaquaticum TaxID=2940653 RepID=UPI0020770AC6|nr:hypothetical protein [Clostridium caldaquaticum]MCM8711483.1 hypothetical protein [Clostridium caldaquaticum]